MWCGFFSLQNFPSASNCGRSQSTSKSRQNYDHEQNPSFPSNTPISIYFSRVTTSRPPSRTLSSLQGCIHSFHWLARLVYHGRAELPPQIINAPSDGVAHASTLLGVFYSAENVARVGESCGPGSEYHMDGVVWMMWMFFFGFWLLAQPS